GAPGGCRIAYAGRRHCRGPANPSYGVVVRTTFGTTTAAMATATAAMAAPTVNARLKSLVLTFAAIRPAPATLVRTATQMAPPNSWKALTSAERRPPPADGTSERAAVNAVTKVAPMPSVATLRPVINVTDCVHSAAIA